MGTAGMISAFASLGSGIAQGQAARAAGDVARSQGDYNARVMEGQARDAIRRGDTEANQYKTKVRQQVGAQRAAAAAQGIDLASESVQNIVGDTAYYGELDAATIRNNAYREAFGYRSQAVMTRAQGIMDQKAGRAEQRSSYLTGGMGAISGFADAWSNKPPKKEKPFVGPIKD